MTSGEFERKAASFLNRYFLDVVSNQKVGNLQADVPNGVLLYPTHMLIGWVDDWLCLELVGARDTFSALKIKSIKIQSLGSWLGSMGTDGEAMFSLDGENNSFQDLMLMPVVDERAISDRFPGLLDQYPTKLIGAGNFGRAIEVGPSSNFFSLENVLIVNARGPAKVRIRKATYVLVIKRETLALELEEFLKQSFKLEDRARIRVARTVEQGLAEKAHVASQFADIFLREKIHETTIGDFLSKHPEIITDSLNAKSFQYERTFVWQEPQTEDDVEINPDLMIERQDGYYDIYDLKLPLLEHIKLTKSNRKRRRFIDKVNEGIAQLAHYKEYFSYPKNIRYVEEKFGIKIKDPQFGLIIGNVENYEKQSIQEAKRGLNDITIVDYDTLMQGYLGLTTGIVKHTT